jgi:hypothetical protein
MVAGQVHITKSDQFLTNLVLLLFYLQDGSGLLNQCFCEVNSYREGHAMHDIQSRSQFVHWIHISLTSLGLKTEMFSIVLTAIIGALTTTDQFRGDVTIGSFALREPRRKRGHCLMVIILALEE